MLHRDGEICFVEVKIADRIPGNRERFDEIAELTAERGITFVVLSEAHIHEQGAHLRAALILRYRKSVMAHDAITRLVAMAQLHRRGTAIGQLAASAGATVQDVYAAIAARRLIADRLHHMDGHDLVHCPAGQEPSNEDHVASWFGARQWGAQP